MCAASVHTWHAESEKRKAGGRVTDTETAENKQLLQRIFSELSKGNAKPFVESWADDFSWTVIGTTKWSKTYRGKQAVLEDLMGPLLSKFAGRYTNTAHRFIAEGDYVVVEC